MNLYKAELMTDTKVKTGKVRVSYEHLMEPASVNGGESKYSASIIIPKSDTQCIEVIQKAIDKAVQAGIEKFGKGFKNPKMHLPIHDGDVEKDDPAYADAWYINISNKQKPGLVGPDRREITDPTQIYSGMWGRFTINFYPYSVSGTGVSGSLQNFQKLEDDEPLGGFKASAASDFGAPDEDDFFD